MYFLRTKDEAQQHFSEKIADIQPGKVVMVLRDGGCEFSEGTFEEGYDKEEIKQEKTTADSPQFNGVAKRAMSTIGSAGLPAKIQESEIYSNQKIPRGDNLRAEQANKACRAPNCTATSAYLGNKTPHEMWYGSPPNNNLLPFLNPGVRRVRRQTSCKGRIRDADTLVQR